MKLIDILGKHGPSAFRVFATVLLAAGPCLVSAQQDTEVTSATQQKYNSIVPPSQLTAAAVSTLEPEATETQMASSLGDLIEGRMAGVRVFTSDGAPGAAFSVQVRGVRSIRGYNEPLYVLDGVMLNPVNMDAAQAFWGQADDHQAAQNTLSTINPNDIARIEVLKDAAATALYGAQGANGVVIITTRRGHTASPQVDFRAAAGLSFMAHPIDMLGREDYLSYMGKANPGFTLPYQPGEERDWQKEATRTALSQSYYLSVGGNNDRLNYLVSGSFGLTEGIIERTDLQQGTVRVNLDRRVSQRGMVGVRVVLGYRKNNMTMGTSPYGAESTVKMMTEALPFAAPDGSSIYSENPLNWLSAYDDISTEYSVIPMTYFEAHLAKGLKWRTVAGIDYRNKERMRWLGSEVQKGSAVNGMAGRSNLNLLKYNADSYFKYDLRGNRHELSAMAGAAVNGNSLAVRIQGGTSFFNQDLRGWGISLSDKPFPYQSIETSYSSLAGFAHANYTYDDRYSAGVSMRAEKTFRYDRGTDDLTYYPAASLSWNIAREHLLRGHETLTALKLRAGWGRSGMQDLQPYLLAGSYITGIDPGLDIQNGVTNYYDLRWQSMNEQWNAGLDLDLWNGRLTFTADAYHSMAHDNLRWYYHRRTGEWNPVYSNRAKVDNKGLEFTLGGIPVAGKKWRWEVDVNFAVNNGVITDNGAGGEVLFGSGIGNIGGVPFALNANRNGDAPNSFWGYHTQGIVEERHMMFVPPVNGQRPVPGDVKFVDTDGDGDVTEADRTVIGNPTPKHTFGLHSRLSYRNFSLEVLIDGALKFDVVNLARLSDTYTSGNFVNLREDTYKKAYPAGDRPRFNAAGVTEISSRIVEDGCYARLHNLSLGYRVPLAKVKWISALEVTLTAKNLFVVTDYTGYDPAVGSYGYDLTRSGIDNGAYPLARTFMFGIRATF